MIMSVLIAPSKQPNLTIVWFGCLLYFLYGLPSLVYFQRLKSLEFFARKKFKHGAATRGNK